MPFPRSHFFLALIGVLLSAVAAPAQETSKPAQGTSPPQMVLLNVRVTDEAGHPVTDVRQEDVRVLEDGAPQTISLFSKEEVPLSYGLVIDNSGSMRTQLNEVIDAAETVVGSNRPGDETFLVRFVSNDNIQMVREFTSNQRRLTADLGDLYIEGGLTAVIDAVYLSVDYAAKHRTDGNRRLALILVTDGEDRGSKFKLAELTERLHKEDVQIFVIGLVNELVGRDRKKAVDLLNFLAQETGGRAFYPNSLSELRGIAQAITRDMRTQYLIGYVPTGGNQGNTFHKVQVTVAATPGREKRTAITRVGYIAPPRPTP